MRQSEMWARQKKTWNNSGGWRETSVVFPKTSETKLSTPNHLIAMIGGSQCHLKPKIYPTHLEGQELHRNTLKGSWMIPKPTQRLSTKVQDHMSEEIAAAQRIHQWTPESTSVRNQPLPKWYLSVCGLNTTYGRDLPALHPYRQVWTLKTLKPLKTTTQEDPLH